MGKMSRSKYRNVPTVVDGVRLIKGTSGKRDRMFLDELPEGESTFAVDPPLDCSLLCLAAEAT